MFNKITKGNVINSSGNTVVANRINKGTDLIGDIHAETDIRIDGTVKGNIKCPAKVVLGATAEIEGNIICGDLVVEGKIKGDIHVKQMLYLRSTSNFEGKVSYSKLVVEEGAVIVGSLTNTSNNVKPMTSSKPIENKEIEEFQPFVSK
jgi:cytoskeletal protein CcmA (bactofilin family)